MLNLELQDTNSQTIFLAQDIFPQECNIGRNSSCQIVLNSSSSISRIHAQIKYDSNYKRFVVLDKSSQGTFLRIRKSRIIKKGTTLRLGREENSITITDIEDKRDRITVKLEVKQPCAPCSQHCFSFDKNFNSQDQYLYTSQQYRFGSDAMRNHVVFRSASIKDTHAVLKIQAASHSNLLNYDIILCSYENSECFVRINPKQPEPLYVKEQLMLGNVLYNLMFVIDNTKRFNQQKQLPELQQEMDNEDHKLCQICLDKLRNTVLRPCGHFALCVQCANQLTTNQRECPFCREYTQDYMYYNPYS